LLIAGCATRYVERDPNREEVTDNLGDVVVSQTSEAIKKQPPKCLAVLPLTAAKPDYEPTEDVRKAIHSHLAPTGVKLIPLQKVDGLYDKRLSVRDNAAAINVATGCDAYITGEVTDKNTRFWGIYSEVKIGAKLQILRAGLDKPIWEGKHIAVVRDGGIPLNPVTAVTSAVSAGSNLRQEQITRTTHDLARRLVYAIPGLKFQEELIAENSQAEPKPEAPKAIAPLASLKAELKDKTDTEIEKLLVDELSGSKWAGKDREELAELLIAKAAQNPLGYAEMAKIKLNAGQGGAAVNYAKKLVQLAPSSAENQFLLGRAYLKADKPDEALPSLLKAAGSELPKPVYYSGLGIAYAQQGRYPLAIAAYQKSLELEPNNQFALMQLGLAQAFAGADDEAAVTIRKSIIIAIAHNEKSSAESGLNALTSLGLDSQLARDDLQALQERIRKL
jgi:Flp pilus assembly protein TadD